MNNKETSQEGKERKGVRLVDPRSLESVSSHLYVRGDNGRPLGMIVPEGDGFIDPKFVGPIEIDGKIVEVNNHRGLADVVGEPNVHLVHPERGQLHILFEGSPLSETAFQRNRENVVYLRPANKKVS